MAEIQLLIPKEGPLSSKQRFIIMVFGSVFISFALVTVGMTIYNNSGAAQLDLSRPGYKSVRAQSIQNDSSLQKFPDTGTITQTTINDFNKAFNQQAAKIKAADAFSGDPLNPEALGVMNTNN